MKQIINKIKKASTIQECDKLEMKIEAMNNGVMNSEKVELFEMLHLQRAKIEIALEIAQKRIGLNVQSKGKAHNVIDCVPIIDNNNTYFVYIIAHNENYYEDNVIYASINNSNLYDDYFRSYTVKNNKIKIKGYSVEVNLTHILNSRK